ncbi:hypothetical protein MWH06_03495 [Wolbachia pipientis]|nr:hypothetical protein MWH06_03495 [Wolbachia pipientis]
MELIAWIAGTQLHKRCNFEGNSCTGGVIQVAEASLLGLPSALMTG